MSGMLPDLPDVDWSNPDVRRVLDMFGWKYEQKCKEAVELKGIIAEQDKRIANLEALVKELQRGDAEGGHETEPGSDAGGRHDRRGSRKYNTREFKDYPRVNGAPRTREYNAYDGGFDFSANMVKTMEKTADIRRCPIHGTPLSKKVTDTYERTTEDAVMGGMWRVTNWVIKRRYCTKCRTQHTARPEDVLPGEHYGINIMSIISILRNLIISFESIQKIILVIYGRFINISTLEKMYDTVADKCRPLYDKFMETIRDSKDIRGDHTGWFLNGKTFYALVIISARVTLYHFAPTKSGMVAESILQDFGGITLSDSDSSWNSMGELWQKCLLHYFRNIGQTLDRINKNSKGDENAGEEFKVFARELKLILKRAIKLDEICEDKAVPEKHIRKLEGRISRLTKGEYSDPDCIRFVKRLKREAYHLLTFLRFDVEFHNNASERALRLISRMRQFLYGSRSERGLKTTETMAAIYATCEMRRINPYHFLADYLSGRINAMPEPPDLTGKKRATIATVPAAA